MSYGVDPGALDKRVTVYSFVETSDGMGGYLDTWPASGWAEVCKRWARVEPIRGNMYFEAQQAKTDVTHRVTMRYTDLVQANHTIDYGGRRLDIQSIIDVYEQHEWLELMCSEVII